MLPESLTPEVSERIKFLLETKRDLELERAYAMELVGVALYKQQNSKGNVISIS